VQFVGLVAKNFKPYLGGREG